MNSLDAIKTLNDVSAYLSLDRTITQPAERIAPANRIEIEGVFVCDYLTYPLADQLADKLCAVMEIQPSGWQSSR